jgi:hypothetical protein
VVNDAEISRQHARLTEGEGGWQVEDLASTNGTFVNGQRLNTPALLKPGDLIGFGENVTYEFNVVRDSAPAASAAPESALPPLPYDSPSPAPQPRPVAPQPVSPPQADIPSFNLPASTPPAPEKPASGGVPTWAWVVGIGCGVIALLAVCVVAVAVVIALLGPTLQ